MPARCRHPEMRCVCGVREVATWPAAIRSALYREAFALFAGVRSSGAPGAGRRGQRAAPACEPRVPVRQGELNPGVHSPRAGHPASALTEQIASSGIKRALFRDTRSSGCSGMSTSLMPFAALASRAACWPPPSHANLAPDPGTGECAQAALPYPVQDQGPRPDGTDSPCLPERRQKTVDANLNRPPGQYHAPRGPPAGGCPRTVAR